MNKYTRRETKDPRILADAKELPVIRQVYTEEEDDSPKPPKYKKIRPQVVVFKHASTGFTHAVRSKV